MIKGILRSLDGPGQRFSTQCVSSQLEYRIDCLFRLADSLKRENSSEMQIDAPKWHILFENMKVACCMSLLDSCLLFVNPPMRISHGHRHVAVLCTSIVSSAKC